MVTQLNESSWIRGGGVRPTHFPHAIRCDVGWSRMWSYETVYGERSEMILVRTYNTCEVSKLKRAEYLTSIILLLLDLLLYGRHHTPTDKADTNIDGNEDHMANTDEILFDGYQCEVSKYLPVLIW